MGTLSAQYLSFQGGAAFPINQVAGLIPGARLASNYLSKAGNSAIASLRVLERFV